MLSLTSDVLRASTRDLVKVLKSQEVKRQVVLKEWLWSHFIDDSCALGALVEAVHLSCNRITWWALLGVRLHH